MSCTTVSTYYCASIQVYIFFTSLVTVYQSLLHGLNFSSRPSLNSPASLPWVQLSFYKASCPQQSTLHFSVEVYQVNNGELSIQRILMVNQECLQFPFHRDKGPFNGHALCSLLPAWALSWGLPASLQVQRAWIYWWISSLCSVVVSIPLSLVQLQSWLNHQQICIWCDIWWFNEVKDIWLYKKVKGRNPLRKLLHSSAPAVSHFTPSHPYLLSCST